MLKLQYFGHLMQRANSLEKTLMLGKTEGRRRRGWQRTRWHHRLSGHEFEQALGDGKGQRSLACCNYGVAKSQTQLNNIELGRYPSLLMGRQDPCRAGCWGSRPWSQGECNGSAAGTPTGSRCRMSPPEKVGLFRAPRLPTCELCVHVGDGGGCRVPWCPWVLFSKPTSFPWIPALVPITAFPLCVPLRLSSRSCTISLLLFLPSSIRRMNSFFLCALFQFCYSVPTSFWYVFV